MNTIGTAKWPPRHWAGRCEAVKVLRECINSITPHLHLSSDEATDIAEAMLQAYLRETRSEKMTHAPR